MYFHKLSRLERESQLTALLENRYSLSVHIHTIHTHIYIHNHTRAHTCIIYTYTHYPLTENHS